MVEKDTVRRGYDELGETYAAERPADGPDAAVLERFLEPLPDDARVLDAGCGQGTPALSRPDRAAATVGVDVSREQLRLAAESVPRAALFQGDMTALPFAADAFDALVAYWSLIHVPAADRPATIEEFARVLRPGGRALVCEGTNAWTGDNPDWLDSGVEMQWHLAGADATRERLREAGFEIAAERRVADPRDGDADEGDGDLPWTLFEARLDR